MPYRIDGNKVLHFKNGIWSVKQVAHNHKNAVATVNLLRGLKHGFKPTNAKRR